MNGYLYRTALAIIIAAAGFIAPASAQDAAPESFVGEWYCNFVYPMKIDITMKDGALHAAVSTLHGDGQNKRSMQIEAKSATIKGDAILLEGITYSDGQSQMSIELRPPKDEMICKLNAKSRELDYLEITATKDSPKMAQEFATAIPTSPEEMSDKQKMTSCANNLKQIGIILKMYASEHKGAFPAPDARPGFLILPCAELFPEYLTDPNILLSPFDEAEINEKPEITQDTKQWYFDHSSYWYLGYALHNEEEGMAFIEAYKKQIAANADFTTDLQTADGKTILRLNEETQRATAVPLHTIPVAICRPEKIGDKRNVLFMDGHVELRKYPDQFPMSVKFIEGLKSIDALKK